MNKASEAWIRQHLANNGLALKRSKQGDKPGAYIIVDMHTGLILKDDDSYFTLQEISTMIREGRL